MMGSPPVYLPKHLKVSDEQFLQFVRANPELRMERAATGELIIMPPTGSESGNRNAELNGDFVIWNRQTQMGKVFDSSSGFRLPNGAIRSPDVSWVSNERWNALTPQQRKGFAPICPDFVLELISETDALDDVRAKMQEYVENGCRLGWLIDPNTKTVEVYRLGQPVEVVRSPLTLSGDSVLLGFVLSLEQVFADG